MELGRRWAASPHRPRPKASILKAWDDLLNAWLNSELPLILRDSRQRGETAFAANGRKIIFADNTPANWVFSLALDDEDITSRTADSLMANIPLTFLTKGAAAKRCLNKAGWKVCHIQPVSDRKRYKIENVAPEVVEAEFIRFLSPRNIFLIPKLISGAGELPEVVNAIAAYEKAALEDNG